MSWIKEIILSLQSRWRNYDIKKYEIKFMESMFHYMHCVINFVADIRISDAHKTHLQNVCAIFFAYIAVSCCCYPVFRFNIFFQEIFSILCTYAAVCFWFPSGISAEPSFKISVVIITLIAPIIYLNNSFFISTASVLLLIIFSFILIEKIRTKNLFSHFTPIYVISNTKIDKNLLRHIKAKYKVLNTVELNISDTSNEDDALDKLANLYKIFGKINNIPFYPFPRKIIYIYTNANIDILYNLSLIATEFSVQLLTTSGVLKHGQLSILPISLEILNIYYASSNEKNAISSIVKNKKIWIHFDGRSCITELINIMASFASSNITVVCESEATANKAEIELSKYDNNRNYQIKIFDIDLYEFQEYVPDILFYNMPVKSFNTSENNLKETLIKNILHTKNLLDFITKHQILQVYILSNTCALNAQNWIGASQKLGELLIQEVIVDNKNISNISIIRLPDCVTDYNGIMDKINTSIISQGIISINTPSCELKKTYYKKDIMPLFLKLLSIAFKHKANTTYIYTILPKEKITLDEIIEIVCSMFALKKDSDIRIEYEDKIKNLELDNYPNIQEQIIESSIRGIFTTTLKVIRSNDKGFNLSLADIKNMSTRDLISNIYNILNKKMQK